MMKRSGKSSLTRATRSLQMRAQVWLTARSPMWWAMKDARGLKTVRSEPRSFMSFSWLASMVSRMSSSLMCNAAGSGASPWPFAKAICRSRHAPSWAGAVV